MKSDLNQFLKDKKISYVLETCDDVQTYRIFVGSGKLEIELNFSEQYAAFYVYANKDIDSEDDAIEADHYFVDSFEESGFLEMVDVWIIRTKELNGAFVKVSKKILEIQKILQNVNLEFDDFFDVKVNF